MGTIRIIVLVGAAISLVVSFVWAILTRMPGAARGPARKLLASASWLGDDAKDGDLVKLTGIVRTRAAGERLMSPISNIRCVALRIRAQARRGLDPRATYIEKVDSKPFDSRTRRGRSRSSRPRCCSTSRPQGGAARSDRGAPLRVASPRPGLAQSACHGTPSRQ